MSSLNWILRRVCVAVCVALAFPTASSAHDFWLHPSSYHVDEAQRVSVELLVGDQFDGKAYPRNAAHIAMFALVGPDGTRSVEGEPGVSPAGIVSLEAEGTHVLAYRSHHSRVELDAQRFEDYLAHEGLEHVIRKRAERGQSEAPGVEVFSRCAKSLLAVGDGPSVGHDRAIGMRLELIPETPPALEPTHREMWVRVQFEGAPLADALLTAHHRGEVETAFDVRTDADGRARVPLPFDGEWMLNSVHMLEAPKGVDADWESLWASLTFEARAVASQAELAAPAAERGEQEG